MKKKKKIDMIIKKTFNKWNRDEFFFLLLYLLSITHIFSRCQIQVCVCSVFFLFCVQSTLGACPSTIYSKRMCVCWFICLFVCYVCDPFLGYTLVFCLSRSLSFSRLFLQLHSLHNKWKKKFIYITLWAWWYRYIAIYFICVLRFFFIITISFFSFYFIFFAHFHNYTHHNWKKRNLSKKNDDLLYNWSRERERERERFFCSHFSSHSKYAWL